MSIPRARRSSIDRDADAHARGEGTQLLEPLDVLERMRRQRDPAASARRGVYA